HHIFDRLTSWRGRLRSPGPTDGQDGVRRGRGGRDHFADDEGVQKRPFEVAGDRPEVFAAPGVAVDPTGRTDDDATLVRVADLDAGGERGEGRPDAPVRRAFHGADRPPGVLSIEALDHRYVVWPAIPHRPARREVGRSGQP